MRAEFLIYFDENDEVYDYYRKSSSRYYDESDYENNNEREGE